MQFSSSCRPFDQFILDCLELTLLFFSILLSSSSRWWMEYRRQLTLIQPVLLLHQPTIKCSCSTCTTKSNGEFRVFSFKKLSRTIASNILKFNYRLEETVHTLLPLRHQQSALIQSYEVKRKRHFIDHN